MRPTMKACLLAGLVFAWTGGAILAQDAAPATAPQPTAAPAATPTPPVAEEIVVTGSYIKGTPEDAALPVDVTDLEDMRNVGAPSVVELVRNLSYTSGNLAETNQFQPGGQGNIGVATINVRGLGSARTLVLFNGRRHVAEDVYGVDVSAIPKSVIGRVETLKDGAAALYGSDAIGGVVNFITREGFEGVELSGSEQFIDGSDGDHSAGLMAGWAGERANFLAAFEWNHRSVLQVKDRGWALKPWEKNPEGGWTAIANPATIVTLAGATVNGAFPDPNCEALGGSATGATPTSTVDNTCRFQYTFFDNLVEDQDTFNTYAEFNFDITDSTKFHAEYLYAYSNAFYKTSPSFAPQSNTGPDRFIPATHPGFAAMIASYPTVFPAGTTGGFVINRSLGVSGCNGGDRCLQNGEGQTYDSDTIQTRVALALTGDLVENIGYNISYTYSSRDRTQNAQDMFVERMAFALDGLGGPNCNQSTAVAGDPGCFYFNPFSNAIRHSVVTGEDNPAFNPAVANDPELLNWLYGPQHFTQYNRIQVIDGVLNGELPWLELPGGPIGWAGGFQVRLEKFDFDVSDLTNLELSPCPFNNPRSVALGNISAANFAACQNGTARGTGPYAFLANFTEEHNERTVYAFFGELSLPIFDKLDAQLAVRFEDYGGSVGSTVDPKLAIRFTPWDWVTLRGSVSTTFRAPPQSFLSGRATGLEFVIPAGSFKAVDTFGNPDLKPEEALATNVGVVLEWEGLYASLDWWRLDFEKSFYPESQGQLSTAYTTIGGVSPTPATSPNGCQTLSAAGAPLLGWGMNPANPDADPGRCNGVRQHMTFSAGTDAPSTIQRVDVNWLNGADILTQGLDFYLEYTFDDLLGGALTVGGTGTYTFEYTSNDFKDINGTLITEGGDFNGFLNDATSPFTPKPEFKSETFIKYNHGIHNATLVGRYVTSYTDAIPSLPNLAKIDNFFSLDMHYNLSLFEDSTMLSFSIMNLTDENPPFTSTNLNYDPFTHDARGRMYKIGLTYNWKPE